jgi:hypothetical protein
MSALRDAINGRHLRAPLMLSLLLSLMTSKHTYVGICYVDTSEDSIGTKDNIN